MLNVKIVSICYQVSHYVVGKVGVIFPYFLTGILSVPFFPWLVSLRLPSKYDHRFPKQKSSAVVGTHSP